MEDLKEEAGIVCRDLYQRMRLKALSQHVMKLESTLMKIVAHFPHLSIKDSDDDDKEEVPPAQQ
jgi:hypothetical protein